MNRAILQRVYCWNHSPHNLSNRSLQETLIIMKIIHHYFRHLNTGGKSPLQISFLLQLSFILLSDRQTLDKDTPLVDDGLLKSFAMRGLMRKIEEGVKRIITYSSRQKWIRKHTAMKPLDGFKFLWNLQGEYSVFRGFSIVTTPLLYFAPFHSSSFSSLDQITDNNLIIINNHHLCADDWGFRNAKHNHIILRQYCNNARIYYYPLNLS